MLAFAVAGFGTPELHLRDTLDGQVEAVAVRQDAPPHHVVLTFTCTWGELVTFTPGSISEWITDLLVGDLTTMFGDRPQEWATGIWSGARPLEWSPPMSGPLSVDGEPVPTERAGLRLHRLYRWASLKRIVITMLPELGDEPVALYASDHANLRRR